MAEAVIDSNRAALLRLYSTQTMTHGGYIIALVIGFTTLVSRWNEFDTSFWTWEIFLALNSIIFVASVYLFFRTLFWGYLATHIIDIQLEPQQEQEERRRTMERLHLASCTRMQTHHRIVYYFKSLNQKEIKIALVILFVGCFSSLSFLSCLLMPSLYPQSCIEGLFSIECLTF